MKPPFRTAVTIAAVVGLAVLSGFVALRKPFSDNLFDLLPAKDQVIAQQQSFLSAIDAAGTIIADLESDGLALSFDSLVVIASALEQRFGASTQFAPAGISSPGVFLDLRDLLLRTWGATFTQTDSIWLAQRINADSLGTRLDETLQSLFVFSDRSSTAFGLTYDPFGFAPQLLQRLGAMRPSPVIDFDQGHITNTQRTRILMLLSVPQGKHLSAATTDSIHTIMKEAQAQARSYGAVFEWMGALRAADDNRSTIRSDINRTAPISIALIIAICLLVYRKFYYGLLVFIPTLLGILVAVALVSLLLPVSVITLGFGAALMGITVDFAVHYFFHIESHPADLTPGRTLAPAIWASALTTAAAFAVLSAAGIPALTQLGILTALGIVLVALFALVLLPRLFPPKGTVQAPRVDLSRLFTTMYTKVNLRAVALATGAIAFALWVATMGLRFDGDPDNLNGMSKQTRQAEEKLASHWPGTSGGTFLVVSAPSANEAIETFENRAAPALDALVASGHVYPATPLCTLVPSQRTQRLNRARWQAFWTTDRLSLIENAFTTGAPAYGLDPVAFAPYRTLLTDRSRQSLTIDSLPPQVLSGPLRTQLAQANGIWYAAVPVIAVSSKRWQPIKAIADSHEVLAVNSETLGLRLVELVQRGFMRSVVLVPLAVIFVLSLLVRNARRVLLALIPCLCATGMTLGIMALSGTPINLVSAMVLAFIFGVGIDYAVFMVHTIHTQGRSVQSAARGCASITIAALTSIASLGVMAAATHPVLASLGFTGLVGITCSYLCAVVLVPALMVKQ